MGQTQKRRTTPPECSYFKLFQILVIAGVFYFSSGTQVTKLVNDKAHLPCGYNISAGELTNARIYWQKNNEMVLSVIHGKTDVWHKYKNRTIYDTIDNSSIVILGLRLSDSGEYSCIIQMKKEEYKVTHKHSVTLLVRAEFPKPNITDVGNQSTNIRRINCSTSGGFPKPHLLWLANGKEVNAIKTAISQDPATELYSINSVLDFNVTNNHSFICVVKYGNETVSKSFTWQKSEIPHAPVSYQPPNLYLLLCLFVPAFVISWCLLKRFSARQRERRRRNNVETIEMERTSSIYSGTAEPSG
ncbi:T-lymphocyte activation antigen CD80 isoform 1-T3 [Molossus nigricans]